MLYYACPFIKTFC